MAKLTLFAAAAALMLAVPAAYAADVSATTKTEYKRNDDGSYNRTKTTERETRDGTAVREKSEVDVEKDDDGTVKKTVTNETVNDPKGLMNKTKTKTVSEIEEGPDGATKTFRKEINGEVVEDEEVTRSVQ